MVAKKSLDPCTATILDFIAGGTSDRPVGESGKGNYNAYFGYPNSQSPVFSTMTIQEIFNFQDRMLATPLSNGNKSSSALGRYQFLKATLSSLVVNKGFSLTDLFTEELQDDLAVELLIGRGYKSWWRGQILDPAFAHGLASEWASLPDPNNGGRSAYDKDSYGNHSNVSLTTVYQMLVRARELIKAPPSNVPPVPPTTVEIDRDLLNKLIEAVTQANDLIVAIQGQIKDK